MHMLAIVLIALAGQTLAAPPVGAGLGIRNIPDALPLNFCNKHCDRLCNSPAFSGPLLAFIEPCCSNSCNSACRNLGMDGGPAVEA
ncbi:hypothetical protein DL764_005210 [Monosporascus ibericus]|uniref:Uncharacterized protein n=1 Tax=Monosporascus ibericus TaxID=155417 RepID=A0A4Q4TDB5_9PEZI|nr:hypothetical protein DL764_005210 [Monosporascus ibericus]